MVQLWWSKWILLVSLDIILEFNMRVFVSLRSGEYLALLIFFRSSDCFSLGWPMRDDGSFFTSTRDVVQCSYVASNTLPFEMNYNYLLNMISLSGEKGFFRKTQKHRQSIFCRDAYLLAHFSKFWQIVDLLYSCSSGIQLY